MRKFPLIIFIFALLSTKLLVAQEVPLLKGPYLGQKPPGLKPEVFAPGIISTGLGESSSSFTPDGMELYFVLSGESLAVIISMKEENGLWNTPQVVSFSGKYYDGEPKLSPDGNKILFFSNRPLKKESKTTTVLNLWFTERTEKGWSVPVNFGPMVNSKKRDVHPTIANSGNLYFSSDRSGNWDIYVSRLIKGSYSEPQNLDDAINSKYDDFDSFIAPDESYIIFSSEGRADDLGDGDLYISFRRKDGGWSKAKHMGTTINSESFVTYPYVTVAGKYFFYSSYKRTFMISDFPKPLTYEDVITILQNPGNGQGDIYWVDAKIINKLRTKENH